MTHLPEREALNRFVMRYPGDPDQVVLTMDGQRFKQVIWGGQPGKIVVSALGDNMEPVPGTEEVTEFDEIVCDTCNAEIKDADFVAVTPSRAYCQACFDQWLKPYLLPHV